MNERMRITAKENPAVRHYRHLRDQKKARRTEGLFVIEGLRIVEDAMRYPGMLRSVFLTDTAWEKFGERFAQAGGAEVFHVSDAVGSSMSDTAHTQGVFALCTAREHAIRSLPDRGRFLVLCRLQDPGNMGMILRTADALGITAIISCGSCELYNPKVVRATMGSIFRVPVYEVPEEEGLAALQSRGIRSFAAVPDASAVPLCACTFTDACAVWIGNEGNGLPAEVIAACDKAVTIPMQGGPESLNAAMAAGICMWEMMKPKGEV